MKTVSIDFPIKNCSPLVDILRKDGLPDLLEMGEKVEKLPHCLVHPARQPPL